MTLLIVGLVLFLGAHSARIFAEDWRASQIVRLGEMRWKGLYSLVSLVGIVFVAWGFALARLHPIPLWTPSVGLRHLASLLTLAAFILVAAAYVPRNALKSRLGHPMVLGVKVWALAHLLANHTLADVVLFGTFLVWAVLCFRRARARDRRAGTVRPAATATGTALTVVVGIAAWALFAFWLHGPLIGVRPFG